MGCEGIYAYTRCCGGRGVPFVADGCTLLPVLRSCAAPTVVITESGAESLTDVPRTVAEVEAVMAGKLWPLP